MNRLTGSDIPSDGFPSQPQFVSLMKRTLIALAAAGFAFAAGSSFAQAPAAPSATPAPTTAPEHKKPAPQGKQVKRPHKSMHPKAAPTPHP